MASAAHMAAHFQPLFVFACFFRQRRGFSCAAWCSKWCKMVCFSLYTDSHMPKLGTLFRQRDRATFDCIQATGRRKTSLFYYLKYTWSVLLWWTLQNTHCHSFHVSTSYHWVKLWPSDPRFWVSGHPYWRHGLWVDVPRLEVEGDLSWSVTVGQVVLSVGQRQNAPWLQAYMVFGVSYVLVFNTPHDSRCNFWWTIYSLWVTFKTSGQSSTFWPILEIWQAFFVQRLHDDYKQSLIDADCPNPLIMAAMLLGRADVRVEMGKLQVADIEVIRTAVIRV